MHFKKLFYIIAFIIFSANGNEETGVNHSNKNVSLILIGRSGSGVSTTVRKLLGSNKSILKPETTTNQTLLEVYEVPLKNGQNLKIVDVKGLLSTLGGRYIDQDIQVLSTLKSYLHDPEQRASTPFFLIVSNFDDTQMHGFKSTFIKTVRSIQMLHEEVYGNTTNTALLLTRLMSETKSAQRKPQRGIEMFRKAIRDFTSFSAESLQINVGENLPEEYDLKVENGLTKLPNKEYYPENVFDSLVKIASDLNNTEATSALEKFISRRNLQEEIVVQSYPQSGSTLPNADSIYFAKLHLISSGIEESELTKALANAFNNFNFTIKPEAISSLIQLGEYFQSNNLTTLYDLPQTTIDKARFFRTVPKDEYQLELLTTAFNLVLTDFIEHPWAGYGFDVTWDVNLVTTPFKENNLEFSLIGYPLPAFISCSKLEAPKEVDITFYNETLAKYVETRLRLLGLDGNQTITNFKGNVKTGFAVKPLEQDSLFSLSTVKEVRTIKCELDVDDGIELNDDFKTKVNELGVCDTSVRDSVAEWQEFFNKYGTHVVSLGYAGGRIEGSLRRQYLTNDSNSDEKIYETLERIVNFNYFDSGDVPTYKFDGGFTDIPLNGMNSLPQPLKEIFLRMWKNSLKYEPIMLQHKFELIPISRFVKLANSTAGEEVEKCVEILLTGKLNYQLKEKPIRNNLSENALSTKLPDVSASASTEGPFTELNEAHVFQKAICPFKPEDYKENTVGQGFNLLNGTVLSTSPFDLGNFVTQGMSNFVPVSDPNGLFCVPLFGNRCNSWSQLLPQFEKCFARTALKMKSGVNIVKLDNLYIISQNSSFNSLSEYIFDRILRSGNFYGIEAIPKGFTDEIPGWVSIQDHNSLIESRSLHEMRISKLEIRSSAALSSEFLKHFGDLPPFSHSDCAVKRVWKQFFGTYGTHYVQSAHVGQFDMGDVKSCPNQSSTRGNSKVIGGLHFNCDEGLIVLKPSLVLEKIGIALVDYPTYKVEVDEAYYWLLKNNLEC